MTDSEPITLDGYYNYVFRAGRLPTPAHARRWSDGVLRTLGTSLDGRTKRALARVLPKELADSVRSEFRLLHFRNPNQSGEEFRRSAARRSGNTDAEFALYPTLAVFGGVKRMVDSDLDERVAKSLSPEIRSLWKRANELQDRK